MAQCGLPVIAGEASAPLMDEIYYFQRGRGDASAGAFEALLKSFAELSKPSQKRRLVLADEIEAITEPGAAAKIISSLLEWFAEDESIKIVLVTHLGEGLRGMSPNIRIDGIEAEGLDEDLNLIVDRNPKMNKIARSTPELIVERLSRKEKSPEFYRYILGKFKKTKKP
jgi:dsDNA-specific endonuclease/ATPase MutS2